MLAIDLGSRTTKAVHMQRRGEDFALCGYALLDAPIYERTLPADLLTDHLKALSQALPVKTKFIALTVGVNDSVVRSVELPRIPADEMRQVLKNNSRAYMQQDMTGYIFDCYVIPPWHQTTPPETGRTPPAAGIQKEKVLVASAKKQFLDELVEGIRGAGFIADQIVPSLIGPVNAFEMALPEVFKGHAVALVDIGFKSSSICILQRGELFLSRIVAMGGDKLTTTLSESMKISYAEAEGIKVGMPQEVQPILESVLTPLGRELRASIDFFEHQQDKVVSQVFISGAAVRSEVVMRALQNELLVECKTWDPTAFLQMELPPQQAAEIEQVAPRLSVAVGAALAAL
jgi:type IV pilus assembly protein PilM